MTQQIQAVTYEAPSVKITGADAHRLVNEWREVQEQMKILVEREKELRNKVVFDTDFFDSAKTKGAQSYNLGNGWKITATKKINWSTRGELEDGTPIEEALLLIEESAGKMAADELIKFKPEVKLSIYEKLTKEEKAMIDPFLTSKPGTPELKIVEPKK